MLWLGENGVCELIAKHSDKELMGGIISPELLLLMEADLLADTGAQGVVMDIWIEAMTEEPTFESMLEHIGRFTQRVMQNNPMVTPKGRSIWEEKRRLVDAFVESYQRDLIP